MRTSPSVVYLPHISEWWHVITEAARASFVSMFNDLDPSIPVLLLATSDVEYKRLSPQVGGNLCSAAVNSYTWIIVLCVNITSNRCWLLF